MSIIKSILPLVAVQLLVSASPTPAGSAGGIPIPLRNPNSNFQNEDGTIKSDFLNFLCLKTRSKYTNTLRAYEKNTGESHPLSIGFGFLETNDNITTRAVGSDPLQDDSGELWQGAISVGVPAQQYTVDFDTGSSDLFLPGSTCRTNCQKHKIYNPKSSSAALDVHKIFSLAYGDGSSVKGEQYKDTVSIAGLTATGQTLGAASAYSSGFAINDFPPDGLMGMGYQSISVYNAPPVFQTLVAQKQTTQPVFGFKLSQSGSELYLGGVDTNEYTGSIQYTPVTVQGYWQVTLDSVSLSGTPVISTVQSIIDTGTTLIVGDPKNVQAFYAKIPGSKDASRTVGPGYYTFPCNSIPQVSLMFGKRDYAIAPSLFNLGRVSTDSSDCVGGIVASQVSFWIVGDLFLQNVYTSFDLGNNTVGFATLK